MQYVGQTKNKFSVRWTAHRSNRNKFKFKEINDKVALLKHYANYYKKIVINKPCNSDCIRIILLNNQTKEIWTGVKTVGFQNWMPKLI